MPRGDPALARRLVEGYVRGMTMTDPDTDADFDTLAYARRLREAGVEAKQAEAARTVRAGLATKAALDVGLDGLETRFDARLVAFEARFNARLDTRLAALETRLTIRFFGGMVVFGSVIVAAVKLL